MSIDLGALAARGQRLVESAIRTSGTKITITRDADDLDATVDFDTLEVTDPTLAGTVAAGVNALIAAQGTETQQVGPNRARTPGRYVASLPVAVLNVQENDVLIVTSCRDRLLLGARLRVTDVLDASTAAVRTVHAVRI